MIELTVNISLFTPPLPVTHPQSRQNRIIASCHTEKDVRRNGASGRKVVTHAISAEQRVKAQSGLLVGSQGEREYRSACVECVVGSTEADLVINTGTEVLNHNHIYCVIVNINFFITTVVLTPLIRECANE